MRPKITKLTGTSSGKTLAIFCGVHGNEKAGIMTVDYLRKNLDVESGTVYLVEANPKAIAQNVRQTEKNLNRCFVPTSIGGNLYEEKLATELMDLLDTCDALLDLHSYNQKDGEATPFAITELNAREVVKNFDVDFVLTNIDSVEKGGTDAYMSDNNKIGICVELGAISTPELFVDLGIKTAYQFLQCFGAVQKKYDSSEREQKILRATGKHIRENEKFEFSKKFKTFDPVKKGDEICTDGTKKIVALEDMVILFPGGVNPVGTEAYITAVNV